MRPNLKTMVWALMAGFVAVSFAACGPNFEPASKGLKLGSITLPGTASLGTVSVKGVAGEYGAMTALIYTIKGTGVGDFNVNVYIDGSAPFAGSGNVTAGNYNFRVDAQCDTSVCATVGTIFYVQSMINGPNLATQTTKVYKVDDQLSYYEGYTEPDSHYPDIATAFRLTTGIGF